MESLLAVALGYATQVPQTEVDPERVMLLDRCKGIGKSLSILRNRSKETVVGRNWLFVALLKAAARILHLCEDRMFAIQSLLDVHKFLLDFEGSVGAVAGLLENDMSFESLLASVEKFLTTDSSPTVREHVADECTTMITFFIARWIAFGNLPPPTTCFFIDLTDRDELVVNESRLPFRITVGLAADLLIIGRDRQLLDEQNPPDHQLCTKVFSSIFHSDLKRQGVLLLDELERAASKAGEQWGSLLWLQVHRPSKGLNLTASLKLLRETLLCSRGDLWKTFVELSFSHIVSPKLTLEKGREIGEAFRSALHYVGLRDTPAYENLRLFVAEGIPDDQPLMRVRRITLEVDKLIAPNTRLFLDLDAEKNDLHHYEDMFLHHLELQFSLHALTVARSMYREAIRSSDTNRTANSSWRTLNQLHFLLTNYCYFLHNDVQETQFVRLVHAVNGVQSLQQAKAAHTRFLDAVLRGAFCNGTPQAERVRDAIGLCCAASFHLHQLFVKFLANGRAQEFQSGIRSIHQVVDERIFPTLVEHLSLSSGDHNSLWSRLDFNRWLSTQHR
jgi:hypothetical protein